MNGQFPKKRLQIKLSDQERGVYSALHTQADPHATNKIKGREAVEFFKRSKYYNDNCFLLNDQFQTHQKNNLSSLPKEVLKQVWSIASFDGEVLEKEDFYVALRLISYAQNNMEVSQNAIQMNIPAPLPKFGPKQNDPSIQQNPQQFQQHSPGIIEIEQKFEINQQSYERYLQYFNNLVTPETKSVQGQKIKDLFLKSQLPKETLSKIWKLSDQNNRGELNIQEFCVAVHLLYLAKQGIEIPNQLPMILQKFILTFNQSPINSADKYDAFNDVNLNSEPANLKPFIQESPIKPMNNIQVPSYPIDNQISNSPLPQNQPQQLNIQQQQQSSHLASPHIQRNPSQEQQTLKNQPILNPNEQNEINMLDGAIRNTDQQILNKKRDLVSISRQAFQTFQDLKSNHEKILQERQDELSFLSQLLEGYQGLHQKLQESNEFFRQEIQKMNLEKDKIHEGLKQVGGEIGQQCQTNVELRDQVLNQNRIYQQQQGEQSGYKPKSNGSQNLNESMYSFHQQQFDQHQSSNNNHNHYQDKKHDNFDINVQVNNREDTTWNDIDKHNFQSNSQPQNFNDRFSAFDF